MTNNDELLAKFGKLLDARFETEREHTRKMVREEVAVEGERTKRADALSYIHVDTRLDSIEDRIKGVEISNTRQENALQEMKQGQKRLEEGQTELAQGLAQTNKTLLQIKTVVETTEETVNNMDAGLTEVVNDHRERIKRLEEQTRTTSHKN